MGHTEKAGFWNVHERPHADLREAIERFEAAGELRRIRGASWRLEMRQSHTSRGSGARSTAWKATS